MQSIRFRLARSYVLALTVTMVAFGAAVYWERSTTAPREAENQLDKRLSIEASNAARLLRQESGAVPFEMTASTVRHDSGSHAMENARPYFDAMADYVFVADRDGRVIYSSPAAQSLPIELAIQVGKLLVRRPLPEGPGELTGTSADVPLRYDVARVDSVRQIGGVLFAAPLVVNTSDLQQIFRSTALMAPIILAAAGILGYWLAGRALEPVEVMILELGAIEDGTTLNRRLPVPTGDDELSRLAEKLNDMLGRVERSFVSLRRFTADASHELKTPLMVLRAGVERSLTHPRTPGEIVPALDETLRQINQMSELVTNLLILARADEGRASLALAECDLRTLVADAAETAEILGEARELAVDTEVPDHAVMLPVDTGRMRQLLMNLVTNAVKYTLPGGRITLRLLDAHDTVTVAVQDTGIGIAPGDVPNVFERFWRADLARSRTGERPGTGLGLAISKWIVEAHGGELSVQSRPGRGTTFTAVLPRGVIGHEG